MADRHWTVIVRKNRQPGAEVWSVGYPTKSAAQAAARRLNQDHDYRTTRFDVRPESYADRVIRKQLEADSA